MKLTCAFMLLCCLHVSASGHTQDKITLNLESADLKKVLTEIQRKTSYRFLYSQALVHNKKVDVHVFDAEVPVVLNTILDGVGIGYQILENKLVVLKASVNGEKIEVKEVRISGKVTGQNGEALAGVSVTVKGTSIGTATDANGNYAINVPDGSATLVFSYVGYGSHEEAIAGRTTINVSLTSSASELNTIVVVGYGTQRKVDVTGSVTQIKGEEISKQSVINPVSGLQGKVAGVQITNSGAPGSSPQIRIRGVGTVYGNANPLYVVDGVWYDDISFLNPADIENMTVLKDASSEAIYGIRAANGVVLVTTKKGRNTKAVVNYNGYVGTQIVTNPVTMATGAEYAQMVNELDVIGGVASRYKDPASYGTTDWYHQILRSALTTNHQVSVSGGSEKSTYNFSLGYLLQDGIVEKNRFERYTAKLQNDFQVFSPLKIGYVVTGSMNKSTDIPGSIFHQLYAAAPIVPVYYADGTYGDPNDFTVTSSANFNPQVTLDFFNQKSKNYRLTGTVYADLKFAQHFTFHTNVGGDFGQNEVRNYNPIFTATLVQRNATSKLSLTDGRTRNWILENTLTYDNR
ncbi:MAG: SusC/RagA family TonB-linked outer membrane protein, partial [Flavisolibacter sp.]